MAAEAKDFRIERLRPERLDDLVEAQNQMFADYIIPIRSSRAFFADFLRSVGGRFENVLTAMDGTRIVGYVNPVNDGLEGWIGGIGILREFRGIGIGTRLMQAAETDLLSKGVEEVSLEVIEGNDKAQRLYQRLGYQGTRKLLTAEARPSRFQGFGENPKPAAVSDILKMHQRAYAETCWQRRKPDALVHSARGAECFRVEGGFVLLRTVETNGFIPFLGVLPEKRRKGVGTALAKFALSRLHDLGAYKVVVYNVNEDEPTLRMLDMFDFKVTMKQLEMKKRL
ncbi:MAG: GNAT family N-acetyltransferase [Thermoplasmata archaeon]|nr:GNAT family N-acetyltransferase [Thermoplasmata archaeon]